MKSHVSDLCELAVSIYTDATAKCVALQPDNRDVMRITARVKHEGLSFLTITLPSFGKDFERSLANGGIDSDCFRSFRKQRAIPAFLQGMLSHVFDSGTGRLLDDPEIAAIEGIRQVAYTFKKLEIPCSAGRTRGALREFKSTEQIFQDALAPDDLDYFLRVSHAIWTEVFGFHRVEFEDLRPRHGPGATAEKISGNQKYSWQRWHERLEPYFPFLHWAYSSENALEGEEFESWKLVSEEEEQPVRVTPVPKTLKGPRIIAIEPVCMQYTQQALSRYVMKRIERSRLTSGQVNFHSQKINRDLALISSADGKFATLDLSSASDRVPYSVAIRMFDFDPDLQGAISSCRSKRAQMPDGEIISLGKFASMGSALCFPVESMYFYTVCVGALLAKHNLPVTRKNVQKMSKRVYIYGDDIVVPTDGATTVIEHLHKYYCKVNTTKSYWTGKFRESCGIDAYDGEVVTPTYIKCLRPDNRRETSKLISWVETSNLFYKRGYWRTASSLMEACESYLGALPIVGPRCAGLGKASFQRLVSAERWSKKHQVFEVKTWCAVPVYQGDKLEGYAALTKCLLDLESRPSADPISEKNHLVKTARHGAVALKRRWVQPQ